MAQLLTFLIHQSEERRIEREEKRAEKLARREAEEARRAAKEARRAAEEARRANAHHQGNVDSFFKLRPPSFRGSESALAAEDWLKVVSRLLMAARISEDDKVPFATLLLRDNALVWWEAELVRYQALGVDPTWAQFSTGFLRKFFPATQEALMETKFANLVQGAMTVDEYTAEFTRLSRFCPVIAASPSEMMKKFRRGLRQEIQDDFAILRLTTFDEVLETARTVELVHQERRARAQSALVERPILAQPLQCVPPRQFQILEQTPRGNGRSDRVLCHYCRRAGHMKKDCWKERKLCLGCGAPDHWKAACPRLRPKSESSLQISLV